MKLEDLTAEQKAQLMVCKDSNELMSMLNGMGIELTDEQLDAVAGGNNWYECKIYGPSPDCPPYGL